MDRPVEFVASGMPLSWWWWFQDARFEIGRRIDADVDRRNREVDDLIEHHRRCMAQKFRRLREELERDLAR